MGFISASCLGGCDQRPGPLGEKTIELDDFDFSTPITDIFPDRYISTEWGEDWYQVPTPSTKDGEDGYLYQKETCIDFYGIPFGLLIARWVPAMPTNFLAWAGIRSAQPILPLRSTDDASPRPAAVIATSQRKTATVSSPFSPSVTESLSRETESGSPAAFTNGS